MQIQGETALHIASRRGYVKVVNTLLQGGASVIINEECEVRLQCFSLPSICLLLKSHFNLVHSEIVISLCDTKARKYLNTRHLVELSNAMMICLLICISYYEHLHNHYHKHDAHKILK